MSVRWIAAAMVVGTAVVLIALPDPPVFQPEPQLRPIAEKPWLSREAEAQIVQGGKLGPLFRDVALGGPAPPAAVRAELAAFAKQHAVDIALEVEHDTLVGIRLGVTFGGCCGYEGVDAMALRLSRPYTSECCGCTNQWVDNWALSDGIVHLRVRVRVNRLELHWRQALTIPEILASADEVLGASPRTLAGVHELGDDRYLLELPFPSTGRPYAGGYRNRVDLGLELRAENDKVVEVSTVLMEVDHEELALAMKQRWGRGRTTETDNERLATWRRQDRIVTLEEAYSPRLTITAR